MKLISSCISLDVFFSRDCKKILFLESTISVNLLLTFLVELFDAKDWLVSCAINGHKSFSISNLAWSKSKSTLLW